MADAVQNGQNPRPDAPVGPMAPEIDNTGLYAQEIGNGTPIPMPLDFRGIINFYKRIGRWLTHIRVSQAAGRVLYIYIGSYATATEAARAYDKASLKYFNAPAVHLNYSRTDYQLDIEEMATYSKKAYITLLNQRSKLSRAENIAEGVIRCPEGYFEVKVKELASRKYRFLGRFGTLEDAIRVYQMEMEGEIIQ